MLRFDNGKVAFDFSKCQQCGSCESICPKKAIKLHQRDNGLMVVVVDSNLCVQCRKCINICPSVYSDSFESYFNVIKEKKFFLGCNMDDKIRRESSSGGVCKTLIIESLKSGFLDGVYSLRKSDKYPYAEGAFYTKENIPSYNDIPNSVYHSVMIARNINEIKHCNRLMVVGTSCQLRTLEKALKGKCQELIKVCIFCKQQKTIDSTRFLSKIMGANFSESDKISVRYRGEGWPGTVDLMGKKLPWNRAAQLPFGRRLWTVPGCNICGDPFGLNCYSDISLMDPWIIKNENDLGETLISINTETGFRLLDNTSLLRLEEKNICEVEPALMLKDIWRKQQLVPFFYDQKCNLRVRIAGNLEQMQRMFFQFIVEKIPRMPILFYRLLCKFPDLRNIILR